MTERLKKTVRKSVFSFFFDFSFSQARQVKNLKPEIGFFGVSLVLFLFMSFNNFISHSEFWSIAVSGILGQDNAGANHYKLLFHLPLKLLYFFPLSNVEHIQMARLFFGGVAFTCFFLFLLNIRSMVKNSLNWMIFGFFLLSFQIYFYNSFRVRADLISNLFIIMAYTLINKNFYNNHDNYEFKAFKTIDLKILTLCVLAFLSTPKAVYLIFAIISYQSYLHYKSPSDLSKILLNFVFSIFLPIGLLFLTGHLLVQWGLIYENPYAMALRYHINSTKPIFSPCLWSEIFITLKINFLNWFLIFLGFLCFLKHEKHMTKLLKGQIILFVPVLLILVVHPEKWSYFIAQLIPFLSLPFLFVLRFADNPFKKLTMTFLLLLSPFVVIVPGTFYRSNSRQMETIKKMEKIMEAAPSENYFDSMGLLPRGKALFVFLGPNDPESRRHTLSALRLKPPGVIFLTSKLGLARPELNTILQGEYRAYRPDVWIHKRLENSYEFRPQAPSLNLTGVFGYDFVYLRMGI